VSFDPVRESLVGEDTLRIAMLAGTGTLRLKLDDALRVESVSSPQAGRHLFFRVRNQDSLMISLGALSGYVGEIRLTVRYSGTLRPGSIQQELLAQAREGEGRLSEDEVPIERVLAYTNREAWYPQGSTDDYATARLRFDVPLPYIVVTGGRRSEPRVAGDRYLVEYVQDEPGRYFTAVVGRVNEIGSLNEGGVELRAFSVPRLRGEAAAALRQCAEMLRFYSSEFGPPPYSRLNVVWTEGYAPGGHSPPGMVLMMRRPMLLRSVLRDDPASFPDSPDFHLAHELAHQWWGHGVAPQNYRERWISEASAQYAAALWVRRARGDDAFQGVLRQLSRWALRHTALGPIHLGYRLGMLKGDEQIFRAIVYDKGAYVLHMLRALVGEQAFREALVSLQSERRFQKIGADHVRAALEKSSGRQLRPYFDEWIAGTRLPTLRVSQRAVAGGLRVEVAATHLPGPVPLEIEISGGPRSRVERVMLEPTGSAWTFAAPPQARAEVNPNREILAKLVKD
jgi:aminopeptidase N